MHDHTGFTSYTSFETMRSNKPTIYDKYIDISKNKMPQIYYNSHFMIFRGHGNETLRKSATVILRWHRGAPFAQKCPE